VIDFDPRTNEPKELDLLPGIRVVGEERQRMRITIPGVNWLA